MIIKMLFSKFLRYNTSEHAVEFIGDDSFSTYWESETNETVAAITVEFEDPISISKIFIHFQSSLPQSLELQYFTKDSWSVLQYYSTDCFVDFHEMANRR